MMALTNSQEDPFFGDLLTKFRKRKKLTQSQLAQRIEASRETISLWERGMYKPDTKLMMDALVKALDLDDEEERLFFEAYIGTASILPLHNFPEHNPYFTGREETLHELHAQLTAGKHIALIQLQAISGLGGIGKTQIAIEYAYRFRKHYHDILWVAADSRETLTTSYLTLARHLRLREREEREQHKVIEAVKRWLREHKGWLLILDNIEDLELVREFVPTPRQGAVVFTTRQAETKQLAYPILVDIMPEEEGVLFLLKRSGYLVGEAALATTSVHDREVAQAIVQAVGGLPLALDQAGAYVAETKRSLSGYLKLFKERQAELLQLRGSGPTEHPQSVTATFLLAFEQVQQRNSAAVELLNCCAFFAPDDIAEEILTEGANAVGSVLQPVVNDPLVFDTVIRILRMFSLIQRDTQRKVISIHRLVQTVIRQNMSDLQQEQWIERNIAILNTVFPTGEYTNWQHCERIFPHVRVYSEQINLGKSLMNLDLAALLSKAGRYMHERGQYRQAEPLLQQALIIREQVLGIDDPQVAHTLHNLAFLYYDQSQYSQAEPLYKRSLEILQQKLGPNHPQIAQPLHGLANVYYEQAQYSLAEELIERGLAIFQQELDADHPQIGSSLNNLAGLYQEQGQYAKAEPLYKRSLEILQQKLGPDHPYTAYPLLGLADIYLEQGHYNKAEPLFERSLEIFQQKLGRDHPLVANVLQSLANLYYKQDKYTNADQLYQQALRIREDRLGPQHPDIAKTLHALAAFRQAQGNIIDAASLYQRALTIREQVLGSEHPKTKETQQRLTALSQFLSQESSESLQEGTQPEHDKQNT